MQAGKFNSQVRIERPGTVQDGAGQPIKGWTLFAEPWANFGDMNGRQFIAADRETSEASLSIRIRYRTDITADMRVVHDSVIYEILAVLPDRAGRKHVDLACKTGAKK